MATSLFSYNTQKTILHKISPLAKVIFTCVFCFFIFGDFFLLSNPKAKILISGIVAFILWLLSKSGLNAFIKLKVVLILGLVFTVFKGFSLEAPFFFDFQLAKDGLLYSYNFFLSTFVALLLFETTTQLEIQNDLQKIPLINKTPLPIILAITISFFPEIFSTWEEVSLAAKARQKPETKKSIKKTVKNLVAQLSALLSCMIQKAEIKRKALLSRQRKY